MYEAKIIADSIGPTNIRLTTLQVTFPRIVLAEVNTHRQFSRNSASSRAIPVEKMIEKVQRDPFIPERFPKNQKGMQASEYLDGEDANVARIHWIISRDQAVKNAEMLLSIGVHKQIANRLLEPWLWHTVIVTSTDWSNFFAQRCDPNAQPEIQKIAYMMRDLLDQSVPERVLEGEYHLPYLQPDEGLLTIPEQIKLCVARCARVSYLSQEGKRDHEADFQLYDRLCTGMHMSPLEHVARATASTAFIGNFRGWHQHRKDIPNECR